MENIWNSIKSSIKEQVTECSFKTWIEPLEFSGCKESSVILSCANTFFQKRVLERYGALIESEIKRASGRAHRLFIEVSAKNSGLSAPACPGTADLPARASQWQADRCNAQADQRQKSDNNCQPSQLPLPGLNPCPHGGHFLRQDFTFDQFVVGSNNDFAYSAALSLASRKDAQQNSLFLLSKTGLGKSHLSQAIGRHILSKYPSDSVYYITADDFSGEMVYAFRNGSIDKFKEKYKNGCDVLLLEDVHYLTGKDRTQSELALILDTLFEAGKRIIFSSCYLPAEIPKLNDRLRSRLSCCLVSNIDPPGFRTRVRILQKKLMVNRYQRRVPEEIIYYLANELTEDVRQLESGLVGVTAKSSLLGAPINLDLAETVVKNIVCQRKNITVGAIKKLVCKEYGISMDDIVSSSRKQHIVRPRQVAIYLSRRYTDLPLAAIGKSFNRYHATALHSIGVVERGLKKDAPVQKQVEFFCQKLESGKF